MAKGKLIDQAMAKKMKDLVGLRNFLAHEYGKLNLELVYEQAKDMKEVEEYLQKIVKYF